MEVCLLDLNSQAQTTEYDDYVREYAPQGHNMTLNYLKPLIHAFTHTPYVLVAKRNQVVVAVLPLVGMRSILFGNQLVSLPFYNYGGIISTDDEAKIPLLQMAKTLMINEGYGQLQIRNLSYDSTYTSLGFQENTEKATFHYMLPDSPNKIGAGNSKKRSKLRSQALLAERRTAESGDSLTCNFGRDEYLDDFYHIFETHMRDLGTPVFSKTWFRSVLEHIPSEIIVVYKNEIPLATGFLFTHDGSHWSIPWASCLAEGNALSLNSYMYYKLLCRAIESDVNTFDFGRSTKDSGPYRFKQQWGPEPITCHWQSYTLGKADGSPKKEGYGAAVKAWQQLPLVISSAIGPHISRTLG